MNHWASWLADVPPTLQRAIARFQRISLPRNADITVRAARLRAALCHARTVRVTYFSLPAPVQAAVQTVRAQQRGFTLAELTAQFGPLRPLEDLLHSRTPHSTSEHLLLLGWLLPRPATHRHPIRYLMPPEVRRFLPRPLALTDAGRAPAAPPPPVVRVAATILLAAAESPLPLCQDGTLRAAAIQRLLPRLTPLPDAAALCQWTMHLLATLGLLAPHGTAAVLSPAGQRFLTLPAADQRTRLHDAWLGARAGDAWLRPLLTTTQGLDLPTFRRRLGVWVAALPIGRRICATTLYHTLAAALGPLADATTHPYRRVDRVPWQSKRAAAIWDAALRGPLAWLGLVAWADDDHCYATAHAQTDHITTHVTETLVTPSPPHPVTSWRYGDEQTIAIPHAALDATVLALLPYACWHAADTTTTTYQLTRRTLAHAAERGQSLDALWALLERQAGPAPEAWQYVLATPPTRLRLIHAAVLVSDEPATLREAARSRSVRRYMNAQLAPGVALVERTHVAPLLRALAQQDLAVTVSGDRDIAPPAALSPAECATLLQACASYRQHTPEAPSAVLDQLERRLWATLPSVLQPPADDHRPPTTDHRPINDQPISNNQLPRTNCHVPTAVAPLVRLAPSTQPTLLALMLVVSALHTLLLTLLRRAPIARSDARSDHAATLLPAPVEDTSACAPVAHSAPAASAGPTAVVATPPAEAPLTHAIARRQTLQVAYTDANDTTTTRAIRPLRLEWHADRCYLYAYCCARQAERCFRTDRITALHVLSHRPQRGSGSGQRGHPPIPPASIARLARRTAQPTRAGFIAPPPPTTGNPLVRVWLEE